MRQMTTAEFAKANLAALEEPVAVRRYTTMIGKYYPDGFEPATGPVVATIDLGLMEASSKVSARRISDLEEEVSRLEQELARRPTSIAALDERLFVDAVGKTMISSLPADELLEAVPKPK
jgi:hypothetical protein